jgi:hypothetical protein
MRSSLKAAQDSSFSVLTYKQPKIQTSLTPNISTDRGEKVSEYLTPAPINQPVK